MISRKRLRRASLNLLKHLRGDVSHAEQVARLALDTFDGLRHLHGLGRRARRWMECAALLHDIGRSVEDGPHHKASYRIILEHPDLPMKKWERRIVGAIARYHRGATPSRRHAIFECLTRDERHVVRRLSAFLRLADAMDPRHRDVVAELDYEVSRRRIVGRCRLRRVKPRLRHLLLDRADAKGALLERVFDRNLELKLQAA